MGRKKPTEAGRMPALPGSNTPHFPISTLYKKNLSLLTDLYQLTMGYGYWKDGTADRQAVFNLYFRKHPFGGAFTIACGLSWVIDYLQSLQISPTDIAFLRTLTGNDGKPLFEEKFLTYLSKIKFSCNIDAVPEGTIVHPNEPLIRVQGPLIQCQLIETALLCMVNFQTLIATKAARIKLAARGRSVLEFGLRRAQGIDGSLSGSWAAHIGGCDATSNVLASQLFGIPVKGTHAHSWVMSYESEMEAFLAYAQAMPNNCVFLVDTYDTISGITHAIQVGRTLREHGYEMVGIRLDSGDISELSIQARKMLDEAGFEKSVVVASDDLDEFKIEEMFARGAMVSVLGVGTNLITGGTQSALGGVYKLAAIENERGDWEYKVKLSETTAKISNPGIQQVRRFFDDGIALGDVIYDIQDRIGKTMVATSAGGDILYSANLQHVDLLVPIFRKGKLVYAQPSLSESRQLVREGLESLPPALKQLNRTTTHPVNLERHLSKQKADIIEDIHCQKTTHSQDEVEVKTLLSRLGKAISDNPPARKPGRTKQSSAK